MEILKLCCRLLILQVVLLQIAGCGSGGDKRSHETLPVTQVRDPRAEVYYQVFCEVITIAMVMVRVILPACGASWICFRNLV